MGFAAGAYLPITCGTDVAFGLVGSLRRGGMVPMPRLRRELWERRSWALQGFSSASVGAQAQLSISQVARDPSSLPRKFLCASLATRRYMVDGLPTPRGLTGRS